MILDEQVELASTRVDAVKVGLDPITIITILTAVLPQILSCFMDNDDVSASTTQARVKKLYEANPKRMLRRTKLAVEKEHKRTQRSKPKSERTKLTDEQAEALALAIIEQTIAEDSDIIVSACSVCEAINSED